VDEKRPLHEQICQSDIPNVQSRGHDMLVVTSPRHGVTQLHVSPGSTDACQAMPNIRILLDGILDCITNLYCVPGVVDHTLGGQALGDKELISVYNANHSVK
jgi:hypothetical protein